MRAILTMSLLAAALGAGEPSAQQRALPSACVNADNAVSPDAQAAACTAVLGVATSPDERATILAYRGRAHHAGGNVAAAGADFDEAIRIAPDTSIEAYLGRGLLRGMTLRDFPGAIADIDRAIAITPAPTLHFQRGNLHRAMGALESARADYGEALARAPDMVAAYVNRGVVRRAQGDAAGAVSDYDAALRLDPGAPDILHNRGNAYADLNDNALAIADYNLALSRVEHVAILVSRGRIYAAQGDVVRARSDYDRAIALDPSYADAYFNRGNLRLAASDVAGALADYDEALQLDPHHADAYANRATARMRQGDVTAAATDVDRALSIRANALGYVQRSLVRAAQNDRAAALADANEAVRLEPTNAEALVNQCQMRGFYGEQLDDALAGCDAAIAAANTSRALEGRGGVHLARSEWRAAIEDYDAALRAGPPTPGSLYGRGLARLRVGDVAGRADMEAAREMLPNVAELFRHIPEN